MDASLRAMPPHEAYANTETIAGLIHEALVRGELGRRNEDRPLADVIQPGTTVLIKPNWVYHRNQAGHGMACMVTQPEFILAALDEVLKARPARVIIGDAPIQSCNMALLVPDDFRERAAKMAAERGTELKVVDFRRTIVHDDDLAGSVKSEIRDESRYVLFDTGKDSLLEAVSEPVGCFRVTDYDPAKLARSHRPGRHLYLLCREAFEADLILSLPKLKLHRKAGLTGALKNLVGMNGDKDYLPHHRAGGSEAGGDCYPGKSLYKRLAELSIDMANRRIGTRAYKRWGRLAGFMHARAAGGPEQGELQGSWYGNDTCWRMVLDLNRILVYGKSDATIADRPQRRLWSLTDAIVCGQGEGPLSPEPLVIGAVTFSSSAPAADAIHAALLRLDAQRIPLIRESFGRFRWPLAEADEVPVARFGDRQLGCDQVAEELGRAARAPKGWAGRIERA